MNSVKKICVEDIDCLNFWINYFGCCYPNGYDESNDISVSELMEELCIEEVGNWWEQFTGYYEGVLDESDGYLENPTTLEEELLPGKILKIEFHPGDILYFINGEQVGSTGPHYELQRIPYEKSGAVIIFKKRTAAFSAPIAAYFYRGERDTVCQRKDCRTDEKLFPGRFM